MTLDDIARKLETIDSRLSTIDTRLSTLEESVDDGFNASKVRDEELHRLTRFGLKAVEVLSESVDRRFDSSDRKHDEQISLLKDVIRQNPAKP